jgi:hypothetical protein
LRREAGLGPGPIPLGFYSNAWTVPTAKAPVP